ncbi:hypothetical protein SKA53_14921 [Yoonia vestfoldensis SKA53]|uniref:Uncharacterized protein n=1 Tax=Yoonia vestfoldensis SKA53 TaxID=314232 RepID=A3V5D2_9RHOB|nr:hypothetical protein SKA53_14921 [Yoonia vestfoldensis SKA53]
MISHERVPICKSITRFHELDVMF